MTKRVRKAVLPVAGLGTRFLPATKAMPKEMLTVVDRPLIQYATPGKVAAFIAESIQGVGGTVVFPDGYLRDAYAHARAAGGVCIADEVQTAYGRMGTHFYAFEAQGVVPDIVVLGKPIGNGYPLGAVVIPDTHEIVPRACATSEAG